MRTKHKRKQKLAGKIESLHSKPYDQHLMAKYGANTPAGVFRVDLWQNKLRKQMANGKKFHEFCMSSSDGEAMLSFFMWPFMALDEKFFLKIAEAISFYNKHDGHIEDVWRFKISDPTFLLKDAYSTAQEIAERVGYEGDMDVFRRILRKMKRQHLPAKRGPKAK